MKEFWDFKSHNIKTMTCFYVTFISVLGNYFYGSICHKNNSIGSQFSNCDWKLYHGPIQDTTIHFYSRNFKHIWERFIQIDFKRFVCLFIFFFWLLPDGWVWKRKIIVMCIGSDHENKITQVAFGKWRPWLRFISTTF